MSNEANNNAEAPSQDKPRRNSSRYGSKRTDLTDPDYYGVLGITKTATPDEIKKAYRKKALKCHPDKNLDDPAKTEEFQKINKANAILSDPRMRHIYDSMGPVGIRMAEEVGPDYAEMVAGFSHPCARCCMLILCTLTLCCCCCCFCCCCNFCCGRCAPKHPEENDDHVAADLGEDEDAGDERQGLYNATQSEGQGRKFDENEAVTEQP